MDWWIQVLTVGGLAGVVSAAASHGLHLLDASRKAKSAAEHLALQLAVSLEAFAALCASAAAEVEMFRSSSWHIGSGYEPIPDAPTFPEEPDAWRALEPSLRNRALSLSNTVRWEQAALDYDKNGPAAEPDPRAFVPQALERNIKMALLAMKLSEDLRRRYRWWDQANQPEVYSSRKWMEKELDSIETDRKNRVEAQPAAISIAPLSR